MNIQSLQNNNSKQNFQAREHKNVKMVLDGVERKFKIYQIEHNDRDFIQKMNESIHLPTNISPKERDEWHETILQGTFYHDYFSKGSNSFLLVTDKNKPCGVVQISDSEFGTPHQLANIATWPINGEKIKKAGTILMKSIMEDFHSEHYVIYPRLETPGQVTKFYEKFGAKTANSDAEMMVIPKDELTKKSKELSSYIKTKRTETPKHVDLSHVLDLNI